MFQNRERFGGNAFVGFAFVLAFCFSDKNIAYGQWNPIKTVKEVVSTAGVIAGAPFGGLIDAATKPTINSAENAGHRLIADIDGRMESRIAQMGDEVQEAFREGNRSMNERLSQLDRSMEQRIYQLDGVISKSLLEVDRISEARVQQLNRVAEAKIDQLDGNLGMRIKQIDQVMERRIKQIDVALGDAIAEVDERMEERINQLDEIAESRIGNADVVATKATLSFESAITRILGIACLMAFVSFLLWRIVVIGREHWEGILSEEGLKARFNKTWTLIGHRLFLQGAAGSVALFVIYVLFLYFPGSEQGRINTVATAHEDAFYESLASFDFRRARFHASQLQILVPNGKNGLRYRGLALKADLIRDVLSRPGLVQSPQGLSKIMQLTSRVASHLPLDPDVLTIQAYVTWNTGTTRDAEYEAARICVSAINASSDDSRFALLPLATNYLNSYLASPLPDEDAVRVHNELHSSSRGGVVVPFVHLTEIISSRESATKRLDALTSVDSGARIAAVRHILEYNEAASELLSESTKAYIDMLNAHAEFETEVAKAVLESGPSRSTKIAEKKEETKIEVFDSNNNLIEQPTVDTWDLAQKAKYKRFLSAKRVVDAWRSFDVKLRGNFWVADSSTALAAFRLNDAMFTRAAWFFVYPDENDLAPTISGKEDDKGNWVYSNMVEVLGGKLSTGKNNKLYAEWPANELENSERKLEKRLAIAPPRLTWAERYQPLIGDASSVIMSFQEFQRFQLFEQHLSRFDKAYLSFLSEKSKESNFPELARHCITASEEAANLGLHFVKENQAVSIASVIFREGINKTQTTNTGELLGKERVAIMEILRSTRNPLL